jgi:hypothetical protein
VCWELGMASEIGCNSLWKMEIAGSRKIFSEPVNEKVLFMTHLPGLRRIRARVGRRLRGVWLSTLDSWWRGDL